MKNILILLLLLLGITNSYPQLQNYYYEIPSGTTNNLKGIARIYSGDAYGYYICGDNGTLIRMRNVDSNCVHMNTSANRNLNNFMKFSNSDNLFMYVFGNDGMVLKTGNMGINWSWENTGFYNNLISGIHINYSTNIQHICVGSSGIILKKDGSNIFNSTWDQVPSGTGNRLNSICSYGQENIQIWIAGMNGTILKSLDTGKTWFKLYSGLNNNLNSVLFLNKDTGLIAGDGGIILLTKNGGLTWENRIGGISQNLNCIYKYNDTLIFVAGDKIVLYSTNSGYSWVKDSNAPQCNFYACSSIYSIKTNTNFILFVGENGKIYNRAIDTSFHFADYIKLDGNNISSTFIYNGSFNNNHNSSGLEWPKGTNKYLAYCNGLCIGAYVNGRLKESMANSNIFFGGGSGEFRIGYYADNTCKRNYIFKFYKIKKGDSYLNNWDWANWGLMVPYGAPFIDVNNNGIYEPAIDTPGVKNASQTIFCCMSDADISSHMDHLVFGGNASPLYAEVHFTAWVYNTPELNDVQFINYEIINKSSNSWNRTQIGIYGDPDLGYLFDDYIGCDTNMDMTYCYNQTNYDSAYGSNPPALGFTILSGPVIKSFSPNVKLGMTSSIVHYDRFHWNVICERTPDEAPYNAYLMMSGLKNDSTCWLDPTQIPPKKTKFCYTGDPETSTGWTEKKGSIWNCGLDSIGIIHFPNDYGDRRFVFSSGSDDLTMNPGDTQRFCIAQMAARGSSNLNSVTELKNLCSRVRSFYETNFPFVINPVPVVEYPTSFMLDQNYPNPFNSSTKIKFHIPKINGSVTGTVHVSLVVYDMLGREVKNLFNGDLSARDYEIVFEGKNFASGMYFYRLKAGDYTSVKRMVLVK
jgi:hypothetical protein